MQMGGKFMNSKLFALVAAASITPASAFAAPVTFFGQDINNAGDPNQAVFTNATAARNNFFTNLSGVGTETFEEIATGSTSPLALTFPSAGTATLAGSGTINSGNDGAGRYAFSGSKYYYASTSSTTVAFSAPIAAFGFYGTDIGDYGGQLQLQLTDTLGHVSLLTVPNSTSLNGEISGSNLYFGFYDTTTSYTSIAFLNNSSGSDVFAFDDMSVGSLAQVKPSALPEPASWAMMISGFGLTGGVLRRRRGNLAIA
jgi:hypothetical protein